MFQAIDDMLADEEYKGMLSILNNNVKEKADGHVDGKLKDDWIICAEVQNELCQKINDITLFIETFL
jgi:hypothetical protein